MEVNLSTPVARDSPFGRNFCSAELPTGVQWAHASRIKRASFVDERIFFLIFISDEKGLWGEGVSNLERGVHLLLWACQSCRQSFVSITHSAGICFSSGISQFVGLLASGWWFLHRFSSFLFRQIYCRHSAAEARRTFCNETVKIGFMFWIFRSHFCVVLRRQWYCLFRRVFFECWQKSGLETCFLPRHLFSFW